MSSSELRLSSRVASLPSNLLLSRPGSRSTTPSSVRTRIPTFPILKGKSAHVVKKFDARRKNLKISKEVLEQIASGRIYAAISSRPGQSGRADGYFALSSLLSVVTSLKVRNSTSTRRRSLLRESK